LRSELREFELRELELRASELRDDWLERLDLLDLLFEWL
jgi:hypothetical protein